MEHWSWAPIFSGWLNFKSITALELDEKMTDGQQKVRVMIRIERRTVKATGTNDWKISHWLVIVQLESHHSTGGWSSDSQWKSNPLTIWNESFPSTKKEQQLNSCNKSSPGRKFFGGNNVNGCDRKASGRYLKLSIGLSGQSVCKLKLSKWLEVDT